MQYTLKALYSFETVVPKVYKIYKTTHLIVNNQAKIYLEYNKHGKNNWFAVLEVCDILNNTVEKRFIFYIHFNAFNLFNIMFDKFMAEIPDF